MNEATWITGKKGDIKLAALASEVVCIRTGCACGNCDGRPVASTGFIGNPVSLQIDDVEVTVALCERASGERFIKAPDVQSADVSAYIRADKIVFIADMTKDEGREHKGTLIVYGNSIQSMFHSDTEGRWATSLAIDEVFALIAEAQERPHTEE